MNKNISDSSVKDLESQLIKLEEEIELASVGVDVCPPEQMGAWQAEVKRLTELRQDVWEKRRELLRKNKS